MIKHFFILSSDVLHLVTKTTLPYKGHRSSRGHCGVTAGSLRVHPGLCQEGVQQRVVRGEARARVGVEEARRQRERRVGEPRDSEARRY